MEKNAPDPQTSRRLKEDPMLVPTMLSMPQGEFSFEELTLAYTTLKKNKATGPDQISNEMLNFFCDYVIAFSFILLADIIY